MSVHAFAGRSCLMVIAALLSVPALVAQTDRFAVIEEAIPFDAGYPRAAADVDGDVDLVTLKGFILTNVTRQLARGAWPRPGRTASLVIQGRPQDAWALAGSPLPGHLALPPHGTLMLDPSSLVVVATGVLPAAQALELGFPVPNDPALVGGTTWWQALVTSGSGPALTGAVRMTITAY